MSRKILPTKEGDISPWVHAFLETAAVNAPILALPAGMTTTLTTAQAALVAQQIAVQEAKTALLAAVETKNRTLREIETTITQANRIVQSNRAVPAPLKAKLGLKGTYAPPAPVVPIKPTELSVRGNSEGVAFLKWKRNGNKGGTIFEIWAKRENDAHFILIGNSTATKFEDGAARSGVTVYYRVCAVRSTRKSEFSNYAVLYPPEVSAAASLRQAA